MKPSKAGHAIAFGARDPEDRELRSLCDSIGATANTVAEAATSADILVLAVPFGALDDVLGAVGELAGKVACSRSLGTRDLAFKLLRR